MDGGPTEIGLVLRLEELDERGEVEVGVDPKEQVLGVDEVP
jgi:hypothetical protein